MSRRIIIVDDEPAIREILRFNFEHDGFEVSVASSEYETLTQLVADDRMVAVIVGDLAPRPGSSRSLVHDIREAFPDRWIPIIMVSTAARESDISAGLRVGVDHYFTKPFAIRELSAAVKELTDSSAA